MRRRPKRVLSFLLTFAMLMSMFSSMTFADVTVKADSLPNIAVSKADKLEAGKTYILTNAYNDTTYAISKDASVTTTSKRKAVAVTVDNGTAKAADDSDLTPLLWTYNADNSFSPYSDSTTFLWGYYTNLYVNTTYTGTSYFKTFSFDGSNVYFTNAGGSKYKLAYDPSYTYFKADNTSTQTTVVYEVSFCDHEWVKGDATAPTCTEKGYTSYTCSKCNNTKQDDFVDALGHNDEVTYTSNADGETHFAKCTREGCEGSSEDCTFTDGKACDDCGQSKPLIVGTGTGNNSMAPFNNNYKYALTETIYPASGIGTDGTINAISYQVAATASVQATDLKIYMKHVSDATFGSTSFDTEDLTLVYSGTPTLGGTKDEWQTFTLDTPFNYNGTDNLMIVISSQLTNYNSSLKYYFTSLSTTSNTFLYRGNDSRAEYADLTNTTAGTRNAYRANIRFAMSFCDHEWDEGVVTQPTCEEQGFTTYTCSKCNAVKKDNYVEALGHTRPTDETLITKVEPTCTETGSYKYVCTVCGEDLTEEIPAAGHSWDTTETPNICTVCNAVKLEEVADAFAVWKKYGTVEYNESDWGVASYEGEASITRKSATTSWSVQPSEVTFTPEKSGTVSFQYYIAYNSNYIKNSTVKGTTETQADELKATSGTWKTYTLHVNAGETYKMSAGLYYYNASQSPSLSVTAIRDLKYEIDCDHNLVSKTEEVAATCTSDGKTASQECTICGEIVGGETIFSSGHSWANETIITNPTCKEAGVAQESCTVCGETHQIEIPKTSSHNFVDGVCTVCGQPAPWDGTTKAEPISVTFDNKEYYVIQTPAELAWFADQSLTNGYAKNAIVANDIDMGDNTWTPMGNVSTSSSSVANAYQGTFDGTGHTITINSSMAYGGLFKSIGTEGVVKNVTVAGKLTASDYTGAIAAYNYGTIKNCINNANISVQKDSSNIAIGGIAGYNYKDIIACVNNGSVEVKSGYLYGWIYAGGIVGYQTTMGSATTGIGVKQGSILNCYNTGAVTATRTAAPTSNYKFTAAGGITGYDSNGRFHDITISDCYNIGALATNESLASGESVYTGGIIGVTARNTNEVTSGEAWAKTKLINGWYLNGTASSAYNYRPSSDIYDSVEATSGGVKSTAGMQAAGFLNEINGYVSDKAVQINNGYPILGWQGDEHTYTDNTVEPNCGYPGYVYGECTDGMTRFTLGAEATGQHSYDHTTHTCTVCGQEETYLTGNGTKIYLCQINAAGTERTLTMAARSGNRTVTAVFAPLSTVLGVNQVDCSAVLTASDGMSTTVLKDEYADIYLYEDDGMIRMAKDNGGGKYWLKDVTKVTTTDVHVYSHPTDGSDHTCTVCGTEEGYITCTDGTETSKIYVCQAETNIKTRLHKVVNGETENVDEYFKALSSLLTTSFDCSVAVTDGTKTVTLTSDNFSDAYLYEKESGKISFALDNSKDWIDNITGITIYTDHSYDSNYNCEHCGAAKPISLAAAVDKETAEAGKDDVTLTISVDRSASIAGGQFDLILPEGITVAENGITIPGMTVSYNEDTKRAVFFNTAAANNDVAEGGLVTIVLNIARTVDATEKATVGIRNAELAQYGADGKSTEIYTSTDDISAAFAISGHVHVNGDPVKENVVEATCSKEGSYDEVVYCTVCEEEISRTRKTVEKLAHTPGEAVKENVVEATCSKEGSYDEVVYCTVCEEEISRTKKTVEKLAHTPEVMEAVAPTADTTGLTEGSRCSVCGEILVAQAVIAALGHPEAATWDGTLDFSWYDENDVQSEYHITTPAQWAALAWICSEHLEELATVGTDDDYTAGNVKGVTGPIPTKQNTFDGIQIYLDNDIDMGGEYDESSNTWSGPNYYPVGSQANNDKRDGIFYGLFYGSFNGQGYAVKNIYCVRNASNVGKGSESIGLFGRVGAADNTTPPENNITIENVAVTGYIEGYRSTGGIVGKTLHVGNDYSVTIQNCLNFATVLTNNGSKGTGGVVGALWNGATVDNCANFGAVTGGYRSANVAGVSGAAEGPTSNSYNVGTVSNTSRESNAGALALNQMTADVTNSYALEGSAPGYTDSIVNGNTLVSGGWMTADEMQAASFAKLLGDGWTVLSRNTTAISPTVADLIGKYPLPVSMTKTTSDPGDNPGGGGGTVTPAANPITLNDAEHGSITSDLSEASAGTKVTLTAKPDDGYAADQITVSDAEGKSVEVTDNGDGTYSFTMPSGSVNVNAAFAPIIDIDAGTNGTATVDNNSPKTGDKVTVTVKPDDGYVVDGVTAADKDGKALDVTDNGDGTYSFTKPEGNVSVKVTYKNAPSDPDENCPSKKYSDLDTSLWYHEAVDFVLNSKYFQGTSDTTFEPDGTMTRAMFVTVLSRLEGIDAAQYSGSDFTDVETGQWYTAAIQWASQNGIVLGIGEQQFDPNGEVTREQMAAIMYRYAQYKKIDTTKADASKFGTFSDKDSVSDWAVEAMTWATGTGIINGTDAGIEPQANSTRAQVAQIVKNYTEKVS